MHKVLESIGTVALFIGGAGVMIGALTLAAVGLALGVLYLRTTRGR